MAIYLVPPYFFSFGGHVPADLSAGALGGPLQPAALAEGNINFGVAAGRCRVYHRRYAFKMQSDT